MTTKKETSIFIIDDSQTCIDMCRIALKRIGYSRIHSFLSSTECLNSLVLDPKVIFLDYNMDHLNGLEILKKIKTANPLTLVVFVSSQDDISVAVNALKYGAFDYIAKKDFNIERIKLLMEKIEAMLEIIKERENKGKIARVFSTLSLFSLSLIVKDSFPK
jgi:DNA-binding NtrC family response regulator